MALEKSLRPVNIAGCVGRSQECCSQPKGGAGVGICEVVFYHCADRGRWARWASIFLKNPMPSSEAGPGQGPSVRSRTATA